MTSSTDQVVVPWSGIEVTLLVSVVEGLIFYCFFLFQRGRDIRKNRYDLYEPRQHNRSHRSPEPFPKYWWKAAWNVSQEETLRCVGLDSFMFLRFLRLGIRFCALGTVLSIALIPLYATGSGKGPSTVKFNLLTLARVNQNEHRLWGTLVCWWIFVLFILREFWIEWKLFAYNRYEFLSRGDVDTDKEFRYAIRVEQIPREYRSDIALKEYFSRLFPNQVRQALVYFNADHVQKLVDERLKLILKVETIDAQLHAKPKMKRPMIKVGASLGCCGGQKLDAIDYYMSEIERLNNEIDTARKDLRETETDVADTKIVEEALDKDPNKDSGVTASVENPPEVKSSTGFVTFTSLRSKQTAVQCELTGRRDSFVALTAPDPKGIIWDNITAPLPHQKALQLQASGIWTTLVIFWSFPIAFVTSIANLNSILKATGAGTVNSSRLWYGLVSGVLPVVALAIFMAVLYMALVACATRFIRYKSMSEVDSYTLYWYQMFQFANLWNIVIVGSAFNQIKSLASSGSVSKVVDIVATALPGASIFFANMILLGSFGSFGLELSMLPTHGVKLLMSLIQSEAKRTQRMLDGMNKPPSIVWGKTVPPHVFVFLVTLVYMPIVPIMEILGLVYFFGSYMVYKHQCLHVYAQEFEGGGSATWMQLFSFLMGCLYVGELVFIAFMGIKKAPTQSILSFILLGITIVVHFMLLRNVVAPIKTLSLEKAAEVDIADGELPLDTRDNEDLLYAVPALNPNMDERGPMPYRRDAPIDTTLPPDEPVQVVVPSDLELAPNPSMASTF